APATAHKPSAMHTSTGSSDPRGRRALGPGAGVDSPSPQGYDRAAMSQESVDLITQAFEFTYTLDNFDTVLANYHPDLVYHPRADEPDPSPHVGRDAYERLIRGFLEAFSEITFDILEVIDAGDCVIASTVLNGRGSASGAD